jgi:hypothetical protein
MNLCYCFSGDRLDFSFLQLLSVIVVIKPSMGMEVRVPLLWTFSIFFVSTNFALDFDFLVDFGFFELLFVFTFPFFVLS